MSEAGTPSAAGRALAQRRWAGTTPEQRRRNTSAAREARQRAAIDRRIRELVDAAPSLTAEQRAQLVTILQPTTGADREPGAVA